MKSLLLIVLLFCSGWTLAEPDVRMAQLEATLSRLQQEQQSAYQQFQMVQELRRNLLQMPTPSALSNYAVMGTDSSRLLDYDENVRLQRERQERLQRYDREIEQAYARFQELARQKKSLLDQMMVLPPPAKP